MMAYLKGLKTMQDEIKMLKKLNEMSLMLDDIKVMIRRKYVSRD